MAVIIDVSDQDWGQLGPKSPEVIRLLQNIANLHARMSDSVAAAITGGYGSTHDTGLYDIEQARQASLRQVEDEIAQGALDDALTPADYLYALSCLRAGQNRFAALAENETRHFLSFISGGGLVDLTAAKRVSDKGADGLFLGGIRMLGLERALALEVKTTTSTASLKQNIERAFKAAGVRDKDAWRKAQRARVIELLRETGRYDEARQIERDGDEAFATLLVVRSCSLDDVEIPEIANQIFDVILIFDLFGHPVFYAKGFRAPRPGDRPRRIDEDYNALDDAAIDFNRSKAAAAAAPVFDMLASLR